MHQFHDATFTAAPIGPIPKNYPRLPELCKMASIRYVDSTKNGVSIRVWSVVSDSNPAKNKKGNITGSASTKFKKFCMLLDLLSHEHPALNNLQIIDTALDKAKTFEKFLSQSWQQIHNDMAKKGVKGYDVLRTRSGDEKDQEFDF
jgi:hypothetical protein